MLYLFYFKFLEFFKLLKNNVIILKFVNNCCQKLQKTKRDRGFHKTQFGENMAMEVIESLIAWSKDSEIS